MAVPMLELARRICIANHRSDLSMPERRGDVPCTAHVREAKLYIGLTEPRMQKTLDIIVKATTVLA